MMLSHTWSLRTQHNKSTPAPLGMGEQLSADAILQASRRLDWRFLLPDPNLGAVAYLGQPQPLLLESLALFSTSLTVLGPSPDGLPAGAYDVVVVAGPSRRTLGQAAGLVRPGGFLYLEAARFSRPLRFPVDYAAEVERLGFGGVECHWHWPNFESCTRIIPLGDEAALRYALLEGRHDLAARARANLAGLLLRSGLLTRGVPHFSLVAQRRMR